VPVGIYLMTIGSIGKGIIMLVWGAVLVHPADQVLRPILISNATHVPFIIVMFGALGGLDAFGLVGLLIGPVLLAIGLAIWREWTLRATV
jgi:predicted PurR-regulated permease PerM